MQVIYGKWILSSEPGLVKLNLKTFSCTTLCVMVRFGFEIRAAKYAYWLEEEQPLQSAGLQDVKPS